MLFSWQTWRVYGINIYSWTHSKTYCIVKIWDGIFIQRLSDNNTVRRLLPGVYDKPKYSTLLDEYVAPDISQVAQVLARVNNWTIGPGGNTAWNLLGLSTQVSARWSFVSDGPYRSYTVDSHTIEFKHRTNREITGFSEITILVIEALKTLGKERISDYHVKNSAAAHQGGERNPAPGK